MIRAWAPSEIYLTPEYEHWKSSLPIQVIDSRHMTRLSQLLARRKGIAAVVPLLTARPPPARRARHLSPQIQDPGNLGTILRTSRLVRQFPLSAEPQ